MGERGRKLIFEKYNWEREAETLAALYKRSDMLKSLFRMLSSIGIYPKLVWVSLKGILFRRDLREIRRR